jgi:hypothetical protein
MNSITQFKRELFDPTNLKQTGETQMAQII